MDKRMKGNIFMNKNSLILTTMVLIFLGTSCSKKNENSKNIESTSDLVISVAGAATDEAVESITESGSNSSSVPMNPSDLKPQSLVITKSCSNTDGTHASVDISYSGNDSLTFNRGSGTPSVTVNATISKTGSENRVWSPAQCDMTNTFAQINWANSGAGSNLTLNVSLNRTINRDKTITLTRLSGSTITKNATDNVIVTGTRTITWAAPTLDNNTNYVSRLKTIISSVTRSRHFTRPSGAVVDLTSTVTVENATPLLVTVVRDNNSSTKALVSKTINSGVVKVAEVDGSYSACTFSNVKYEFGSNQDKCVPTSGSITCEKFSSADSIDPSTTLLINFGQSTTSGVSISVDNAEAEDYSDFNSKGCDLESAS